MNPVLATTSALLFVAAVLTMARLLHGPTTYDRLVALDTLVVIVLSGILVQGIARGEGTSVVLLAIVALVGFLSTVAVLRLETRS